MTKSVCLLGLPGLYQNWLISAIDKNSTVKELSLHNFDTKSTLVEWLKKIDTNLTNLPNLPIVNCYVNDKNFVWYLYNFLEKTDSIGIQVSNLQEDFFRLSQGTIAFDFMLNHFVTTYNITPETDISTINNMLIEYFYFLLINEQTNFKKQSSATVTGAINIEYNDFNNVDKLIKLLSPLQIDIDHLTKRHQQLYLRNQRYIDKPNTFVVNYNNMCLDILEIAYVGYLITKNTNVGTLDWYNTRVRDSFIETYNHQIIKWHNNS